MTKICPKCKQEKSLEEYSKDSSRKDGLQCYCKECKLYYHKRNYENIKDKRKEYSKQYYKDNTEKYKEYMKQYYQENKEEIEQKKKKYRKEHPEILKNYREKNREKYNAYHRKYSKEYNKNRKKNDKNYKLIRTLRCRVHKAIKRQSGEKAISSKELLGCTIDEARQHLEAQFQEGMSWENHGLDGWHIDHIIPCSSFDLTDEEEQRKCFHYTNLQPLWGEDNMAKGNKLDWEE